MRDLVRRKWGPGDRITIQVCVDPSTTITDTMTITYYDEKNATLYTCGHCMPENATVVSSPCSIVYTSGYGGADEYKEVAALKVHRPDDFTNHSIPLCKRLISSHEPVTLLNNGHRIPGKYVGALNESDRIGMWTVQNVPKIRRPCFIVEGTLECDPDGTGCSLGTRHGYSGSPWLTSENELFGYHIARVQMTHDDGRKQEVSVVASLKF